MADLPNWVRVLAGLGGAAEGGLGLGLLEVVHGHVAVIVAHHDQVGIVHVHVETHDAAVAAEDVLREAGVLHAVEQQHASALLHEVICSREKGVLRLQGPATQLDKPPEPPPPGRRALPTAASAGQEEVPPQASSSSFLFVQRNPAGVSRLY